MSNDIYDILGLIMFGALILSVLVETILSGIWNKTYFTTGIPIFVRRIPVEFWHSNIPSSTWLEANFHSNWLGSLAFKEIELHTYGFREKLFEFRVLRYTPIMHGVLFFDYNNHEVVVNGFMNWFTLSFSLIWLGGMSISFLSFGPFALVPILFFVLLMGLLYWIQYYQFSKVATLAAESWSRKYTKDIVEV